MDTKQDQEPRAKSKPQPQATSREKRSRKESHATTAGFMATSKEATRNIYIGLPRRGKRAQKTPKPKYHQALGSRINSSEVPMCIEAYFFFEGPAETLSPSVPPEDLRPRAKNRFGSVDVRPCRFTAPGYSEPRTSVHHWCSPLSSYVMSSITQFVPTRMVVGDIAEATLVAIATAPDKRAALDLLAPSPHAVRSQSSRTVARRSGGFYKQ